MSIGAALSGFAGGYQGGEGIKAERRQDELLEKVLSRTGGEGYSRVGDQDGYYAPETWRDTPPMPSGGGGGGARMTVADPVAEDMPIHQRAFLNATALGESGGAYNVRYSPRGAQTFEETGDHPRVFEKGPHGPSSAAGRYQFTATTWDDMGGGEFTRENQDRRAWALAVRDYKARTGRDLDADLVRDGMTGEITKALAPTWAAFNGKPDRFIDEYQNSFTRYRDSARASNPTPHRTPLAPERGENSNLPSLAETGGRIAKADPILESVFSRMTGAV